MIITVRFCPIATPSREARLNFEAVPGISDVIDGEDGDTRVYIVTAVVWERDAHVPVERTPFIVAREKMTFPEPMKAER
jgi:hypothetical protein